MRSCYVSIDVGLKNMAYCLFIYDENGKVSCEFEKINILEFMKKKEGVVLSRTKTIRNFVECLDSNFNILGAIIERQVDNNVPAMCLMYSLATAFGFFTPNVFIVSPKNKFKYFDLPCVTINKAHKKQSVDIARRLIKEYFPELESNYKMNSKKDDLADCFLQGYAHLNLKEINDNPRIHFVFNR
jgi:hypothetical protein